jgi:hypothetical protein
VKTGGLNVFCRFPFTVSVNLVVLVTEAPENVGRKLAVCESAKELSNGSRLIILLNYLLTAGTKYFAEFFLLNKLKNIIPSSIWYSIASKHFGACQIN